MLMLGVGQEEENMLSGQLEREEAASYQSPVKASVRVVASMKGTDFVHTVEVKNKNPNQKTI